LPILQRQFILDVTKVEIVFLCHYLDQRGERKMSDFDFSKFPRVKELVDESSLKGKEDRIIWLRFTREQAALLLAEMHLMATAALSNSIPLRNRSKTSANCYYDRVGNFLHLVAK
jgi:hypothetical protein